MTAPGHSQYPSIIWFWTYRTHFATAAVSPVTPDWARPYLRRRQAPRRYSTRPAMRLCSGVTPTDECHLPGTICHQNPGRCAESINDLVNAGHPAATTLGTCSGANYLWELVTPTAGNRDRCPGRRIPRVTSTAGGHIRYPARCSWSAQPRRRVLIYARSLQASGPTNLPPKPSAV